MQGLYKTLILLRSFFMEVIVIPCYHPLILEWQGYKKPEDGNPLSSRKKLLKVNPFLSVNDLDFNDKSGRYTPIPCGQCVGCRLDYSRQWANRMMMELESHEHSYFLTLTYNDENVPRSYPEKQIDPRTGEVTGDSVLTLCKRDVQLFMKRLRKAFEPDKIRFYCSGEYGDRTFRPHYHMICFGLNPTDLKFHSYQKLDNGRQICYYISPQLESLWSNGFVVVSEVTWETCAYTARYVMKKLKGEAAQTYTDLGIEPPFSLMSRKPGLGAYYLDNHPDMYQDNLVHLATPNGAKDFAPPKFIDSLFAEKFPCDFDEIHEMRVEAAREKVKSKLAQTSLSYAELLSVEEEAVKQKIKSLRRKIE